MRLILDDPKQWPPWKNIDQIHELILEYPRILAKSIPEQPGSSRERVGSIIHEDLDMRKLSVKWVPKCLNMDQKRIWCQSPENFFSTIQMISCHDWWPWTKPGYVTMTRRQSNNQLSGGIAAHPTPKKFRVQKSAGKVLVSIFFRSTASSSLIIFQRAKLSTRSITDLIWCRWKTFWRRNATERSPRGSCSYATMSRILLCRPTALSNTTTVLLAQTLHEFHYITCTILEYFANTQIMFGM